jgi:hypothetical protein
MALHSSQSTIARIKKISRLRPTLALVLGSGFNHILGDVAGL